MNLYRTTFKAMACDNEIVVAAAEKAMAVRAMEAAGNEVLRIEAKYSRYLSDGGSIVHQINQSAGSENEITCDSETLLLFDMADQLYRRSDGLFDITSGVLRKAWDFSTAVLPDPGYLHSILALVGWSKVERTTTGVRLPASGMEIDFGGFGKEYAADRAAQTMSEQGICHGYVNLGGDISAVGPQPDGKPWLIGVQNPRRPGEVIATIPVTNGGLATSGDSQKYFEINGRRYCHLLNPKSGFPPNCWRSVSISSVSCTLAGACSTIAMLKENEALEFLSRQSCTYLLVDRDGGLTTSSPTSER